MSTRRIPLVLVGVAVIVAALNLRAGISSVGPVLGDILREFGVSGGFAGLITALPGFLFAVLGLSAVPLARRCGLSRTMVLGMTFTLVGLAWRPWVGGAALFVALTAMVVTGIAVANVLLPAWIKFHGGRHAVSLMTVNASILGASGAIGPLSAAFFHGPSAWRWALFFWAFFGAAQVLVWVVVAKKAGFDFSSATAHHEEGGSRTPLWHSPTAVFLTIFYALQSTNAYIQMGYVPQMLMDANIDRGVASLNLALIGALNIVGGMLMPSVVSRARSLTLPVLAFAACAVAGYLGLLWAPAAAPYLWSVLLGVGGWAFPTTLTLIVARTRTPEVTARLSGFVQPIGYIVAGTGPLLIGFAYDASAPDWTGILVVLALSSAAQGIVGVRAAARRMVDDELGRSS